MTPVEFRGDGVMLVGDAAGPPDGFQLVFLHGGGQTRQSWGHAIEDAARRGFRATTVDLRGHGESDWSPGGAYDLRLFAEDVRSIVLQLPSPPVLIGASLGGLASLLAASDPPPPVAGLILVDVAVRVEPEGAKEIAAFMKGAPNGFESVDQAADAVAAYLPHRPRPKSTAGLLRNLRLRDGRYYWHWDPAFMTELTRDRPTVTPMLEEAARRLAVPTLLVRGGRSKVVSERSVREFVELAPATEVVEVQKADHMVAGDENDSFNAAVFAFLERRFGQRPRAAGGAD